MTTPNHTALDNDADKLLFVLDGWRGQDDWGMATYPYPSTCKELLSDIRAGDDIVALRRLAKVAGADKGYAALIALVPHHQARELRQRSAMAKRLAKR